MTFVPAVAHSLLAHGGNNKHDTSLQTYIADTVRSHPRPGSNSNGNIIVEAPLASGSTQETRDVAQALTRNYGKQPENSDTNVGPNLVTAFYPTGGSHNFWSEDISPSMKIGGTGAPAGIGIAQTSGASVRRLTPTECERLQGLPDGWTDLGGTPDSKRYAALGDAVTANVAFWIGTRLMKEDTE